MGTHCCCDFYFDSDIIYRISMYRIRKVRYYLATIYDETCEEAAPSPDEITNRLSKTTCTVLVYGQSQPSDAACV